MRALASVQKLRCKQKGGGMRARREGSQGTVPEKFDMACFQLERGCEKRGSDVNLRANYAKEAIYIPEDKGKTRGIRSRHVS